MWPEVGTFSLLLLLGGWAAVDGTSLGQILVSRPLFAATLAGWAVGAPAEGLLVGIVLEAFHLGVLPVGASRYPESGPAAVVAGAVYAQAAPATGALAACVAFALVWEWVGGRTVEHLRRLNRRFAAFHARSGISPAELERRHLGAFLLDALRGILLTGAGLLLLPPLVALAVQGWGLPEEATRLALGAVVAASLGTCVRLFPGRLRLFALGAGLGLILVAVA